MVTDKFEKTVLSISDDSGFLALVNTERYTSFISSDWSFEQLQQRFTEQTDAKSIFVWRTECEGFYKVAILPEPTKTKATKEYSGEIEVTSGCLYLTNFEDLSMAAQFKDETLPAPHNGDLLISLPNGLYNVTVRHLNHSDNATKEDKRMDFEICLTAHS